MQVPIYQFLTTDTNHYKFLYLAVLTKVAYNKFHRWAFLRAGKSRDRGQIFRRGNSFFPSTKYPDRLGNQSRNLFFG